MTLAYASATRSALRTTTGTQDFTAPSFGTPVGAIVLLTNATADGTKADTKRWSIGFTDGTRHRVAATMSQDAVTTSSNYRATGSARLALLIKTDGSGHDVEVQFDSFITDGIRLNVSTTNGTAYLCTVILFGGADCDLYVNEFDIGSVTAGATLDVTDAGFQPSFIFFVQSNGAFSTGSPTPSAGEMVSLAFAADSGANEQARFSYAHGNAKTASEPSLNTPATLSTNFTNVLTPAPLSPSTGAGLKVNSYLSNGFQVISPNGGDTPPVAYMAVTFGTTPDIALVTTPTTATTRTVSMTDPGCAFFINTIAAATGNLAGNTAGQVGFGFANNEVAFCIGQNEHDNVTTMDNGVLSDDVPIHLLLDDGSATAIKATASFSTTELTLSYSDVQSTARNNYVLLLPRPTYSGSGAGSIGHLTGAGTAALVFSASGAGSLAHLTGSGSAQVIFSATGAGTLGSLSASGAGQLVFVASVAGAIAHITGAATGELVFLSSASGSLGALSAAGTATVDFSATGAGTLGSLSGSATAELAFVATATGTLATLSGSSAAELIFEANGAGTLGALTASGVAAQGEFIATGAGTLGSLSASSTAELAFVAAGAAAFSALAAAAAAELVFVINGAGTLGSLTASGSDSQFLGCPTDFAASARFVTELAGSTDRVSLLDASYDRVTELGGSTC